MESPKHVWLAARYGCARCKRGASIPNWPGRDLYLSLTPYLTAAGPARPQASSRLQGHTLRNLSAGATTYLYWSPALHDGNLIFSALICGRSSRRYSYVATCSTSVHNQLRRLNVRHVLPYFSLLFLLNSSFWLFSCTNTESNSSPDQRVFNYFCNAKDGSGFSFILPISSSLAVPLDISREHV